MSWIIGIDEAGYGPHLGPFVMSSVACRVPDGLEEVNLWRILKNAVRRQTAAKDARLLIEDSKVVYTSNRGLFELERGVLACMGPGRAVGPLTQFVNWLCPDSRCELEPEPWYRGDSALPVQCELEEISRAATRLMSCCGKRQVEWGATRSVVLCAKSFNAMLDRHGSKGAVLAQALSELLRANREAHQGERLLFFIDKHGGRNFYYAILQSALPDHLVFAECEGLDRSDYRLVGAEQEIRLTIQPRADANHFCVALASMVSKYLRELLMGEFNRFWRSHVPELKPTAGYHGDAARFYGQIRPVAERLGIAETTVWRRW
jgi:ribonuclease HII